MLLKAKVATLLAMAAIAVVGVTVAGAAPANAAPAVVCGNNTCIQQASLNTANGIATVNAWANNTTFFGHMQLGNNCKTTIQNLPSGQHDTTFPAGGMHVTFSIHYTDCNNSWSITGWKRNSSANGYISQGTAVFTIKP
jgi:hypothetical protein